MRQLMMRYEGGALPVPENKGYAVRNYEAADHDGMLQALVPLTLKLYSDDELCSVIIRHSGVRPESVFVAVEDGRVIGTATGYTHESDGTRPADDGGTLHMVSALPEASGRGVGRAVCTAVVNYLLSIGCKYIDLTTDDFRKSAIVTYTRLGFRPFIDDGDMQERWAKLAAELALPELIKEAYRI